MGQTLAPFAKGGYIPAYGFGDIRTSDTSIFPLKSSGYCKSFAEVCLGYLRGTQVHMHALAGPGRVQSDHSKSDPKWADQFRTIDLSSDRDLQRVQMCKYAIGPC